MFSQPSPASGGFGPRLDLEGWKLLERAGVREGLLGLPTKAPELPACELLPTALRDMPTGFLEQAAGGQNLRTGAGLADQLSALLDESADDPFCKPSLGSAPPPPPEEPGLLRQQSHQMRQSIASQLSAVLLDDDFSGWEENDAFNTSELANHLAAMGMSPPRCHTAQRKASNNSAGVNSAAQFGTTIQRPLG